MFLPHLVPIRIKQAGGWLLRSACGHWCVIYHIDKATGLSRGEAKTLQNGAGGKLWTGLIGPILTPTMEGPSQKRITTSNTACRVEWKADKNMDRNKFPHQPEIIAKI